MPDCPHMWHSAGPGTHTSHTYTYASDLPGGFSIGPHFSLDNEGDNLARQFEGLHPALLEIQELEFRGLNPKIEFPHAYRNWRQDLYPAMMWILGQWGFLTMVAASANLRGRAVFRIICLNPTSLTRLLKSCGTTLGGGGFSIVRQRRTKTSCPLKPNRRPPSGKRIPTGKYVLIADSLLTFGGLFGGPNLPSITPPGCPRWDPWRDYWCP